MLQIALPAAASDLLSIPAFDHWGLFRISGFVLRIFDGWKPRMGSNFLFTPRFALVLCSRDEHEHTEAPERCGAAQRFYSRHCGRGPCRRETPAYCDAISA